MNYEACQFESLPSGLSVAMHNQVVQSDLDLELGAGPDKVSIHNLQWAFRPTQPCLVLNFKCGSRTFDAVLTVRDAERLLATVAGEVPLAELPEMLLEAMLEKLLATFQNDISQRFGHWLELLAISLEPSALDKAFNSPMLSVDIRYKDKVMACLLPADLLAADTDRKHCRIRQAEAGHLPIRLALSLGYTRLNMNDFEALAMGDVVFFERCFYRDNRRLCLSLQNRPLWLAQLDNNTISIIEPWRNEMNTQVMPEGSEADVAFDTDALTIKLRFEMSEQSMPLSEVRTLVPGYVFDLDVEPDTAIAVKVNDQTLGRGELVSIGGKLGVRLTSVNHGQ